MKNKIYISGHKNPDTDSICSAIAYAELKRKQVEDEVEAIRLGDLNPETKFVLNYFNVEKPRLKDSMKSQVRDLNMDKAQCVSANVSLYKAVQIIQENNINSLPVVNANEDLIGIVSLSNITRSYMDVWDDSILSSSNTSIENIIEVLSGKFIYKAKNIKEMKGKIAVYAMDPKDVKNYIAKDDIVIIGNRKDAQLDAISRDVSLIIISGGYEIDDDVVNAAKKKSITIISTNFNTFMASRLLPQSVPVSYVMTSENLVTFHLNDSIDDVRDAMGKSRFRAYPVLDNRNKVVGSISRYHLISANKKKIILVDHNEKNQSIDDIESAEILEIIDHHRVASIATDSPVYFRNEPVGSTSTIIAKMYFESGIMPSKKIAGILSAAIISDTLLFKSPTSTEIDKIILERLSKISGIDPEIFAMEMFKEGTRLENRSMEDILNGDVKRFIVDNEKIRVCQIMTMDLGNLLNIKKDLVENMKKIINDNGESTFVMMMTDIFKEISEVIVVGEFKDQLAEIFNKKLVDNSFVVEGLLSRKKQMIPKITSAVGKFKEKAY